jgi:hypothetical protein
MDSLCGVESAATAVWLRTRFRFLLNLPHTEVECKQKGTPSTMHSQCSIYLTLRWNAGQNAVLPSPLPASYKHHFLLLSIKTEAR